MNRKIPIPSPAPGEYHINLGDGRYAVIDQADQHLVDWRRWCLNNQGYVVGSDKQPDGTFKAVKLARILVPGFPTVDHRDGNKLDNRRANLRGCTVSENTRNQRRGISNTTGYKGVILVGKRYEASICVSSGSRTTRITKRQSLGRFNTAQEAAVAYDIGARTLFGEYARLNFPIKQAPKSD